jgi:uncharacterized protein
MSANIAKAQTSQAPANRLKSTMQRHPIASYFVIMYTGLWLAYLPLVLSKHGFGVLPFEFPFPVVLFNLPASLAGPLLAGVIMSWVVGGKQGRQEFRKRLFRFKVAPQWYLMPLAAIPVLGVLSVAVVQGVAPIGLFVGNIASFFVSYLLSALLLAVLINLWEESGQIGFALPELQRRHGAVLASLIIAPMWALMHLPAFFVPEMGVGVDGPLSLQGVALSLGVLLVYAVPVRIIATWLFNSAGQSVVVVAVFHAAMNSAQGELQKLIPGFNTFYILAAFAVVSFVLIAVTRGKLGYKREQVPAPYQSDALQPAAVPLIQA